MSSPLDNLIKVSKGGLKAEPADQAEIDGLIRSAKRKLLDAQTPTLGLESSFDLAYNAAHASHDHHHLVPQWVAYESTCSTK